MFSKCLLVRVGVCVFVCACENKLQRNTLLHFFMLRPCSKRKGAVTLATAPTHPHLQTI